MGYYYAFDGDDVGSEIELIMFKGNVEELPIYSQKVTNALNLLKQKMENIGCKSLFCAGDRVVLDVWMRSEKYCGYGYAAMP